jgi:hypothetical protein
MRAKSTGRTMTPKFPLCNAPMQLENWRLQSSIHRISRNRDISVRMPDHVMHSNEIPHLIAPCLIIPAAVSSWIIHNRQR